MIFGLLRRSPNQTVIDRLHGEIMAAARQPALFLDYGVEDSFDGRFEILALLAAVTVRRLAQLPAPGPRLAQDLTDAVFAHFDDALRQAGISDVAVPKRIKKLASAWLGRRHAYISALDARDSTALAVAIARNVHAGSRQLQAPEIDRLVRYVFDVEAAHGGGQLETFTNRSAPFPAAAQTLRDVK